LSALNIQEYIASGVLEAYVTGSLSAEEQAEVERNLEQYPELREELDSIELTLERFAQLRGTPPPAGVLPEILGKTEQQLPNRKSTEPPKNANYTVYAVGSALAFALALVFAFLWYQGRQDFRQQARALDSLQSNCDSITTELNAAQAEILALQEILSILKDPGTRSILMEGTELDPDAVATVFQNAQRSVSLLDIGTLPDAPSGRTYQLWAIVDGNPVDMGVFDSNAIDTGNFKSVPYIPQAQAFAVTIEEEGGSPTPNLDQLYVIGNV